MLFSQMWLVGQMSKHCLPKRIFFERLTQNYPEHLASRTVVSYFEGDRL